METTAGSRQWTVGRNAGVGCRVSGVRILRTITLVVVSLFLSVCAAAQDMSSHNHKNSAASATDLVANDDVLTQDWAKQRLAKSPRHQEWVKVKNGNREVNSFVVYPEVNKKATAVIVIHEIFGMSDWVQSLTD